MGTLAALLILAGLLLGVATFIAWIDESTSHPRPPRTYETDEDWWLK